MKKQTLRNYLATSPQLRREIAAAAGTSPIYLHQISQGIKDASVALAVRIHAAAKVGSATDIMSPKNREALNGLRK